MTDDEQGNGDDCRIEREIKARRYCTHSSSNYNLYLYTDEPYLHKVNKADELYLHRLQTNVKRGMGRARMKLTHERKHTNTRAGAYK